MTKLNWFSAAFAGSRIFRSRQIIYLKFCGELSIIIWQGYTKSLAGNRHDLQIIDIFFITDLNHFLIGISRIYSYME